jgi:hypothetical protein
MTRPATTRHYRAQIRRLHALGPRPVGELLVEIVAAAPEAAPVLAERLEVYGRMAPNIVAWFGGNDWLDQRDVIRAVGGA